MQRDMSKLDSFKRSIMQSIQAEDLTLGAATSAPVGAGYSKDFTPYGARPERESLVSGVPGSPPASSAYNSLAGQGTGTGARGPTPQDTTSAAVRTTSPASEGSAVKTDGKDFFRQARLRLSYEQFNSFLSNIKRLNAHAQSRDETIQKAQEIFGAENEDLFNSFKALLSKHGLS